MTEGLATARPRAAGAQRARSLHKSYNRVTSNSASTSAADAYLLTFTFGVKTYLFSPLYCLLSIVLVSDAYMLLPSCTIRPRDGRDDEGSSAHIKPVLPRHREPLLPCLHYTIRIPFLNHLLLIILCQRCALYGRGTLPSVPINTVLGSRLIHPQV